jgi:hypothetical protein
MMTMGWAAKKERTTKSVRKIGFNPIRHGVVFIFIFALAAAANMRSAFAESIAVTVVSVEGDERNTVLEGVSAAGFKFQEGGTVAAKDIAEVRFTGSTPAEPAKCTLYLRNGDQLKVAVLSGNDSNLKVKSDALGELTMDNKFVDGLIFAQKDPTPQDVLDEFLKTTPKDDLLLLPKGDAAKGALEKLTDKDLNFNVEKQSKTYTFEQVVGVRLVPLEEYKAPADLRATINLADGSRLTGKLQQLDGAALKFEGIDGKPWSVPASAIKSVAFKGGNLVYVSDLTPKSLEEKPYVGGVPIVFHWRRDQSVTGHPLSISGKTFDKGVGVHSFTRLTYDLGGQYAKFLVSVGVDSSAPLSAVCSWKISVDGKEAAAGIAKANEIAKLVKLEVKDAKELELICDYGPDEDDAGDHLDWGNARLIKP